MEGMTKKAFPVITKRVLLFISVAGFVLCALIFAASYWAFNRQFREQYDASIREIAAAARASLNPDDFAKYRADPTPDQKHAEVLELLQRLVDEFDLNVIYVSEVEPPDYRHIFYFYDPVGPSTKWTPYPLGYEEDYYEESYNRTTRRVYEEGAELVRHTIKSRSGSHITAQVPVYDSNGKIVALLGAQKNVQEFVDARKSFALTVIIMVLIFGVVFVIAFKIYFDFRFIKPIMTITDETNRFADANGKPGDALLTVKNKDELETLALASFDRLTENYDDAYSVFRSSGVISLVPAAMASRLRKLSFMISLKLFARVLSSRSKRASTIRPRSFRSLRFSHSWRVSLSIRELSSTLSRVTNRGP